MCWIWPGLRAIDSALVLYGDQHILSKLNSGSEIRGQMWRLVWELPSIRDWIQGYFKLISAQYSFLVGYFWYSLPLKKKKPRCQGLSRRIIIRIKNRKKSLGIFCFKTHIKRQFTSFLIIFESISYWKYIKS